MDTRHYLPVRFFRTGTGNEPVRDWLKSLSHADKKLIGEDIKTVQFGWPIGMPLVRKLGSDIWEVRTRLKDKIARILFTVFDNQIILLHGFIKKTQKTQADDLNLAIMRLKQLKRG
jgi:phage-related protein